MDPLLATYGGSDQTVMCVASRPCARAVGGGVRASDNGKGIIGGAIG